MNAICVAGLAFGDEGKGSVVDWIVRETGGKVVVRYSGGPQAAHNVVTSDGRHHCFSQFGSGTLARASTYLSRFMLIEPYALQNEHLELQRKVGSSLWEKLFIERSCPVITPFHWKLNRIRERLRGANRHGSCGMGVGELRSDQMAGKPVIVAGDLLNIPVVEEKLRAIQIDKLKESAAFGHSIDYRLRLDEDIQVIAGSYREIASNLNIVPDGSLADLRGPYVFEGAQGMLLDETHGFAPYNTWTDITFHNAEELLRGIHCEVTRIGVLRTYLTRHGAGPFPTESRDVNYADHNRSGDWQGNFRQGHFDLPLARYAVDRIGGLDGIVFTHLDDAEIIKYAPSYNLGNKEFCDVRSLLTQDLMMARPSRYETVSVDEMAEMLAVPLFGVSRGPTAEDKMLCDRVASGALEAV